MKGNNMKNIITINKWIDDNGESFLMDGPLYPKDKGVLEVWEELERLIKEDSIFGPMVREALESGDIDEDFEEMLEIVQDILEDDGEDIDFIEGRATGLYAEAMDNLGYSLEDFLIESEETK